jgi:rRNA maturation protein Nop10
MTMEVTTEVCAACGCLLNLCKPVQINLERKFRKYAQCNRCGAKTMIGTGKRYNGVVQLRDLVLATAARDSRSAAEILKAKIAADGYVKWYDDWRAYVKLGEDDE